MLRFATLTLLALPAAGQDLQTVRDELSRALSDVHFASGFASLILLSDEFELSTANYEIDTDFDSELSVIAFPFATTRQRPPSLIVWRSSTT